MKENTASQNNTGNDLSMTENSMLSKPQFIVSVDRDRMKVHLMFMRVIDEINSIVKADVLASLEKKGVLFGIDERAIDELIKSNEFFKDVVVACGKNPSKGFDAEIKPEVSIRECSKSSFEDLKKKGAKTKLQSGTKVKKDELIMTKIPATAGSTGFNVYGKVIHAEPGEDRTFCTGENLYESPDGLELRATVEGIVISVDGVINVIETKKEKIEISISKDEMSATLVITPGDSEKVEIGIEEIKELLKEAGVKYGLRSGFERLIPKKLAEPVEIELASGLSPINGMNGFMKIYNSKENNNETIYKVDESGKVNFRERLDNGIVMNGDIIAILTPPTGGRDGITVLGNQVPAVPGKPGKLMAGRNVRLSEDENQAIADSDGKLVIRGSVLSIDNILEVEGNVDYSTGNITFDGAVFIKGDVLTEFYISASGDIEIKGVVDGGNVISGSDVIIRGAVYGGNKSRIKARGNITLRSADQAFLEAGENINADHFLRNCTVHAGDNVNILHQGKGHILGGKIVAGGSLETYDLGSVSFSSTQVEIGSKPDVQEVFTKCSEEINQTQLQMSKLEPSLKTLNKLRKDGPKLTKEKHMLLNSLYQAYMTLQKKLVHLEDKKSQIEDKMKLSRKGIVTVKGNVYPGVKIRIGINVFLVKDDMSRITISCAKGNDEELSIKQF